MGIPWNHQTWPLLFMGYGKTDVQTSGGCLLPQGGEGSPTPQGPQLCPSFPFRGMSHTHV